MSEQLLESSLRSAAFSGGVGLWLRGSVVGLCATALATAGHALEGGPAPAAPTTAALAGVAVLVSVGLSRVRWGLGSLLVVLTAAQLVFHVALDGGVADTGASCSILAVHLAAALLTAVVLHRGEEACWRLADIMARPTRAFRTVSVDPSGFAPAVRWFVYVGKRRSGLCLVYAAPRRGPPSLEDNPIKF